MADTLPSVLREAAERFGDRPACVDQGAATSFAELFSRVQATARGYASLGLDPGARVVLWGPNSVEWMVAALATSYAGVVRRHPGLELSAHTLAPDLADLL